MTVSARLGDNIFTRESVVLQTAALSLKNVAFCLPDRGSLTKDVIDLYYGECRLRMFRG